jgi:hypothetical protein
MLFGKDSFSITGNHNQLVDPANPLAIERGSLWVEIDPTKINSNQTFSLTATLDCFIDTNFWRSWDVLFYGLFIVFALFFATGFVNKKVGIDRFK